MAFPFHIPLRRPLIIDTDPGVDDALALLLAAASPEAEVLALTTVGGNVHLDLATENTRRVVPIAWRETLPPPIYPGADVDYDRAFHVHGEDGLGNVTTRCDASGQRLYPAVAPVAEEHAADAIIRLARERPGEITLVTLGPLTNVALALERDPEAVRLLQRVVVMGGAFREPGNVTPTAEFNIYVDPEAAQRLCDSGAAVTWVPVDVTHRCVVRQDDLEACGDAPRMRFAGEITAYYADYHVLGYGERACFLHDPLAVGVALWPELVRTEALRVDVETAGLLTRGMTIADFRPGAYRQSVAPNAEVCLEVDAEAFGARFLERLG